MLKSHFYSKGILFFNTKTELLLKTVILLISNQSFYFSLPRYCRNKGVIDNTTEMKFNMLKNQFSMIDSQRRMELYITINSSQQWNSGFITINEYLIDSRVIITLKQSDVLISQQSSIIRITGCLRLNITKNVRYQLLRKKKYP